MTGAAERFGGRAEKLLGLPFIEFLTRDRLAAASELDWRRDWILYPIGYELRPLKAALLRARVPSRFDLWVAERP